MQRIWIWAYNFLRYDRFVRSYSDSWTSCIAVTTVACWFMAAQNAPGPGGYSSTSCVYYIFTLSTWKTRPRGQSDKRCVVPGDCLLRGVVADWTYSHWRGAAAGRNSVDYWSYSTASTIGLHCEMFSVGNAKSWPAATSSAWMTKMKSYDKTRRLTRRCFVESEMGIGPPLPTWRHQSSRFVKRLENKMQGGCEWAAITHFMVDQSTPFFHYLVEECL